MFSSPGEPSAYEAVIFQKADYYPYGMTMPGRHDSYTSESYRYAYNGMEFDTEMKGDQNSYTTEFRQYDPRLGRWLSLDPLMAQFPSISPYTAFDNNPILMTDPLGLASENKADPPRRGFKKGVKGNYHGKGKYLRKIAGMTSSVKNFFKLVGGKISDLITPKDGIRTFHIGRMNFEFRFSKYGWTGRPRFGLKVWRTPSSRERWRLKIEFDLLNCDFTLNLGRIGRIRQIDMDDVTTSQTWNNITTRNATSATGKDVQPSLVSNQFRSISYDFSGLDLSGRIIIKWNFYGQPLGNFGTFNYNGRINRTRPLLRKLQPEFKIGGQFGFRRTGINDNDNSIRSLTINIELPSANSYIAPSFWGRVPDRYDFSINQRDEISKEIKFSLPFFRIRLVKE